MYKYKMCNRLKSPHTGRRWPRRPQYFATKELERAQSALSQPPFPAAAQPCRLARSASALTSPFPQVYGWDQRERVRKDEEAAAAADASERGAVLQAGREERRAKLLERASGGGAKRPREEEGAAQPAALGSSSGGHINFFEAVEAGERQAPHPPPCVSAPRSVHCGRLDFSACAASPRFDFLPPPLALSAAVQSRARGGACAGRVPPPGLRRRRRQRAGRAALRRARPLAVPRPRPQRAGLLTA